MKLPYEKPMVLAEHYQLSQSISACAIRIGFSDNGCVRKDPDTPAEMRALAMNNWFSTGARGCLSSASNGMTSDGICYHTNANATFTS